MGQDQIELGKLIASVELMTERLDRVSDRIAELEEMAHKGRGMVMALFTIGSIAATVIGWFGWQAIKRSIAALGGN